MPVLTCLAQGADTLLLVLWLVLWWRLAKRNRPVLAGLTLALCVAKFHLFLFLPILLIRFRRWQVLKGAVVGISILLGWSFVAGGWHWPIDIFHVLAPPGINPGPLAMPNIHGLFPRLEIPLTLVTVVLAVVAIFKLNYADALAVSSVASRLCSYHSYVMDGVILIPAIVLMLERHWARWPSVIAATVATPVPGLALLHRLVSW